MIGIWQVFWAYSEGLLRWPSKLIQALSPELPISSLPAPSSQVAIAVPPNLVIMRRGRSPAPSPRDPSVEVFLLWKLGRQTYSAHLSSSFEDPTWLYLERSQVEALERFRYSTNRRVKRWPSSFHRKYLLHGVNHSLFHLVHFLGLPHEFALLRRNLCILNGQLVFRITESMTTCLCLLVCPSSPACFLRRRSSQE
ncbi:uncharacterized protein C8R40DRAFT_13411 [Lentinula edodes]|uniref:uncharacterized protein n=1 Tax=Lentinula edodes TaxID=5353 RepID=UPI001E8D2971|nr:uncharacterized protein C8R40DRAFT_13411 [Lentinula edodes]KAH7881037.1 hypothetical protein C8R40DRAFT_13411 [Lentinula edodes]